MLRFRLHYFVIALLLFIVEVLIALYMHDDIVRPYIGDLLVVILLYCFVNVSVKTAAIGVLLFAFLIETGQYFHLISLLGLAHSMIAKMLLGDSFVWGDITMYILGIGLVIMIEKYRCKKA